MENVGKNVALQSAKAGLFSLLFSVIGVLLLALAAKIFGLSDGILPVVNQVSKALSVILGTALSVRDEKFLSKALLGTVVFAVLSFLLFSVLGGAFHWGQFALDLAISLVCAALVAVAKAKRQ